jgi:subtilisin family serine protease
VVIGVVDTGVDLGHEDLYDNYDATIDYNAVVPIDPPDATYSHGTLVLGVAGAFMYFATLTEVPILEGLIGAGMGKGPALALLLAGPALSLPNMLVTRYVMGTRKTLVFVSLVIVMATISGVLYGAVLP